MFKGIENMLGYDRQVFRIARIIQVGKVVEQRLVLVFREADELVEVGVCPNKREMLVYFVLAHAEVE